MGLEDLVGPEGRGGSSKVSDPETKLKGLGSGLVKQHKFGAGEDDWKSSKMAKSDSLSAYKTMSLHQGTPLLRSNTLHISDNRQQELMLSFSSVKSEVPFLSKDGGLVDKATHNSVFPYYQRPPSAYSRNAGNPLTRSLVWFELSMLRILGKICIWFCEMGFGEDTDLSTLF